MPSRPVRILLGWIPAILVTAFLIGPSGLPKFFIADGTELSSFMRALGAWEIRHALGVLEIAVAVLFLIPRTATVGFILVIGFLGGALATNLTHPEVTETIPAVPIILMLLAALSAAVRTPELLTRVNGRPVPTM